jgi:hypothetical protein
VSLEVYGLERLGCRLQILPSKHAFGELGLRAPGRIHHLQPDLGLEVRGGCLGMRETARGMLQNALARNLASWVNSAPIKS